MGVKEVPVKDLIPEKTYMFFSHTHKGQPYNMIMLRNIIEKVSTTKIFTHIARKSD